MMPAIAPGVSTAGLVGCDDPKSTLSALKKFDLLNRDWRTITEARIIETWGRKLLEQGGQFRWLSSGGRVIDAETECGVEFWVRRSGEPKPPEAEDLDQVRVIYSDPVRRRVIEAADLILHDWTAPPGVQEVYDFQRDRWNQTKRQEVETSYQYEWHQNRDSTILITSVMTRVFRSRAGWTVEVSLESSPLAAK